MYLGECLFHCGSETCAEQEGSDTGGEEGEGGLGLKKEVFLRFEGGI